MSRISIHHLTEYPMGAFALSACFFSGAVLADDASFEVYGFAQADYVQDFKRVNPAWEDTLRPSKIPVVDGFYGSDGQATLSVRQSRLGVQGSLPVEGQPLKTRIEIDMFGVGVDEGQTTIRLRHAYGEWGNWLAGQTHSLLMDIDVFPNTIDYWGPSGMVFLRNPQMRWTPVQGASTIAVAIEKPGSDVSDPSSPAGDEKYPDLTAQFRIAGDWGHYQLAGILRSVGFDTPVAPGNTPDGHDLGWGINLSGSVKLGRDKLMLQAIRGAGIATYMNDGGNDMGLQTGDAQAIPLLGVVAYYDHYWTDKLSSSIGYSTTLVDNTDGQAPDAFKRGEYASVNLLNAVNSKVLVGAEFLYGKRTDKNGDSGDDLRLQFSMKYSFSSKDFGQ